MKKADVLKVVSVVVLTALLLLFFSHLLTPTWFNWNNDNTTKGFYREPDNRLQVVFAGTSQSLNGIAPMELYDEYGICAYNLSSEQQPLLASYYWIREAERLHGETLRTVVLDLSFVFHDEDSSPKLSMNEKALAHMRFSKVKLEAYRALADQYGINLIEYIIPLIRYHSRWASLTKDDFLGLTTLNNAFFSRGQNLQFGMSHDIKKADDLLVPNYIITKEVDKPQSEIDKLLDERNLDYLDQIVTFCNEKNLKLVFIKIAKSTSDVYHDALQSVSDGYGIPLIDFNIPSVQEEAGIDFPFDYWDEKHANVSGAKKMTQYIGAFLQEYCPLDDIRENPDYAYMKEQSAQYQAVRDGTTLITTSDLVTYLNVLNSDRYSIFLSVKRNAATGLKPADRELFKALGFTGIETLGAQEPYIGIKSRGTVLVDEKGEKDVRLVVDGAFDEKKGCTIDHVYRLPVKSDGGLKNSMPTVQKGEGRFSVESGGAKSGSLSKIFVNGKDQSDAKNGMNFVIYDHELERIVDTSCFDTSNADLSRADTGLPYKYYMRLRGTEMTAAKSIGEYIRIGNAAEDCTMVFCGTMEWEKPMLSDADREVLAECGVEDPSFIENRPFVMIIRNNTVLLLETGEPKDALYAELPGLINVTVQKKAEGEMTIRIAGETYTVGSNCVYVIAYNGKLNCEMNARYLRKLS